MKEKILSGREDDILSAICMYYKRLIEDYAILPILSLIEFSPRALKSFLFEPLLKDQILDVFKRDRELDLVIDKLLADALQDYTANTTLYPVNEYIVNQNWANTAFYHFGDLESKGNIIPALFTFMINDGRYLSIFHSGMFVPFSYKSEYRIYPAPTPVSLNRPITTLFGKNIRSPQWLIELFEQYAKGHTKDMIYNFVNMLRQHLHIQYSRMLE